MRFVAIAALGLVLATARPAAACHKRHQSPFELFDLADVVAVVRVTKAPERAPGEIWLAVGEQLKGAGKRELTSPASNTSCRMDIRRGHRALVFLAADGHAVGLYESYVEDFAAWLPLLRRYAAATTARDRLAIVLDAIDASVPDLAREGAYYLVDRPELLDLIDPAATARLAAATAPTQSLLPAVLERLDDGHAGFDPAALADAIAAGPDKADRIAALARCERVRAIELYPFTDYHHGVAAQFWAVLAQACRSGTPVAR